ncbi:MAG: hypothetical protein JW716_05415 [Candidatus Aenigmarchaeota archaeon]|nr:hypothetical protein [Candidatus Aenigmarchaeota archaeon]
MMKRRSMKGQTAVFEEVMLFGIGIAIFISSFFIFNYYQNVALDITSRDHMAETLDYIASTIMDISKIEGNVSVNINIPEKINEKYYYTISLGDNGIELETIPEGIKVSSNLYGIMTGHGLTIRENSIASVSRKLMIYKRGNEIGINTINI